MPHYWAAHEDNALSRNTFRLCQKMGDVLPEGFVCPIPTLMRPIFAGMGQAISGFQTNRLGSRFGTNTKLFHGVIGPIPISSLAVKLLLESVYCLIFSGEIAVHIQRYFLLLLLFTSLPFYEFVEKIGWQMVIIINTNPDDI